MVGGGWSRYSDVLHPSEVLLVWDRVVGFDSLNVLPVLATAIFAYVARVRVLLACRAMCCSLAVSCRTCRVARV